VSEAVHVASGKVREIYSLEEERVLLVASERISTCDVVLARASPDKGRGGEGLWGIPDGFREMRGHPVLVSSSKQSQDTAIQRRPWQVFSREVLLEQVWGYRHAADTRLVNVHVQRLRGKVEIDPENPEVIVTVRGVGYRAGPP